MALAVPSAMRVPAAGPLGYVRREPEETDLYRIIHAHFGDFLERAGDAGGLPRFVRESFERYLRCGVLAHGFARVWCAACGDDMLVAWSCKRRGLCSSCGGRRMAETAAHLCDGVFPRVAVRQWVLTFPYPLRVKLAYDARLRTAVLGLFVRCVTAFYERAGAACGRKGGQVGSVTAIQRFGSALNVNLHFHTVFTDGVFYRSRPGHPLRFRALPRLTEEDVKRVFDAFVERLGRLLRRRGVFGDDDAVDEAPPEEAEPLAQLALASSRHLSALGPAPAPVRDAGHSRESRGRGERVGSRLCVDGPRGMSLHAATAVKARQRSALERLLCYVLRPPVVPARVRWRDDGMVELSLSRPWSNGTRCFLFTPLAFIGRLVPLIPAPGTHDVRYHGVFAPNARWRREVVAMAPCRTAPSDSSSSCDRGGGSAETEAGTGPRAGRTSRRIPWSELLKRTFGLELLRCARCGGKRQILAVITDLEAARSILKHLGLPQTPPSPPQQRAPPQAEMDLC